MTKIEKTVEWIDSNICQYIFHEDEKTPSYDINITVLLNGDRALLIDAGYMRHAEYVKSDLEAKGIVVDQVILSHYHPDHASGASHFESAEIACSDKYELNFTNCNDIWNKDHNYRRPSSLIRNGTKRSYGPFSLRFMDSPGHCQCSIITLINESIAHVGDLLMNDSSEMPMLPSICADGSFTDHIDSLERLKALGADKLLLSHGLPLDGKAIIDKSIELRLHYLKTVLNSKGQAGLEEALISGSSNWSFSNWHKNNLKNLSEELMTKGGLI